MKLVTRYLWRFILTTAALTLLFRSMLSFGIENKLAAFVTGSSIFYGMLMFISGWIFGKLDSEYLPIFDIGFRFHLSTFIVHNGISLLWVGFGPSSQYESIFIPLQVCAYWSVFLIIHFLFYLQTKKTSINSLKKDSIFD